jgi:hypothetical protein
VELLQFSLNSGIARIGCKQLAKTFRLLPALDFEDLGTGCAEQLLRRLNPSHPTRRLLLVIFHDICPGYLKTDFVRKDSL